MICCGILLFFLYNRLYPKERDSIRLCLLQQIAEAFSYDFFPYSHSTERKQEKNKKGERD